MQSLYLDASKLLYLIAEMHRESKISDEEKLALKFAVFKSDQRVMDIFNLHKESEDYDSMSSELINLVKV